MASTLMMAIQNSSSPKAFTLRILRVSKKRITTSAEIQWGKSGHQKAMYPVIAIISAIAATIQANQYDQPTKNPADGPKMSSEKSTKDL